MGCQRNYQESGACEKTSNGAEIAPCGISSKIHSGMPGQLAGLCLIRFMLVPCRFQRGIRSSVTRRDGTA